MTRGFTAVLFGLIGMFVVGAIVIILNGRPVANMAYASSTSTASAATSTTPATPSDTYTLADVKAHATEESCWSTVNGDVYDLTTWISRHPGGSGAILGMCGKDGSSAFNRRHGNFPAAQSALILLKIGTLSS